MQQFIIIRGLDAVKVANLDDSLLELSPNVSQMVVDEKVARYFEPRRTEGSDEHFALACNEGRVELFARDDVRRNSWATSLAGEEYQLVKLANDVTFYLCIVPWDRDPSIPLIISRDYEQLPLWVINHISGAVTTLGRWQRAHGMAGAPSI